MTKDASTRCWLLPFRKDGPATKPVMSVQAWASSIIRKPIVQCLHQLYSTVICPFVSHFTLAAVTIMPVPKGLVKISTSPEAPGIFTTLSGCTRPNGKPVLRLFILNSVAAHHQGSGFFNLVGTSRRISTSTSGTGPCRKADNIQGQERFCSHGVYIAQSICRGYGSKGIGIVHHRCKIIHCLDNGYLIIQAVNRRVVEVEEPQASSDPPPEPAAQHLCQVLRTQLRSSPGAAGQHGQPRRLFLFIVSPLSVRYLLSIYSRDPVPGRLLFAFPGTGLNLPCGFL